MADRRGVKYHPRMPAPQHPALDSSEPRAPWIAVFFLGLILAFGPAMTMKAVAEEDSPRMWTASSASHLWLIHPDERNPDQFVLSLHTQEMDGPHLQQALPVASMPVAMAAWNGRVWMLSPARDVGGTWQHDVYSLQAIRRADLAVYSTSPSNRFELNDPLPATSELMGLAAGDSGLFALFAPEQAGSPPRLMQKRGGRWQAVELPDELRFGPKTRLALDGSSRDRLNLLTRDPGDAGRTLWHRRDRDGAWRTQSVPLDLNFVRELISVDGRLAAVHRTSERMATPFQISYLRPDQRILLAELPVPSGFWSVRGMKRGAVLIEYSTRDHLSIRMIDPVNGEISESEIMTSVPLPVGRLWHMIMMLTLAVIAVLVVVLVRPGDASSVRIPAAWIPAAPLPRCLALLVDLIPGAVLAVLILRVPPVELLRLPIITDQLDLAAPFLIMIGVAGLFGTLGELVGRASPGKALLGLRVLAVDGKSPPPRAILIRNAIRIIILIVPPLAVFALLSPHMQGFNDLLARTVVVRRRTSRDPKPESDQTPRNQDDGQRDDSSS